MTRCIDWYAVRRGRLLQISMIVGLAGALLTTDTAGAQPTRRVSRRTDIDELHEYLLESESGTQFHRTHPADFGSGGKPDFDQVSVSRVQQLLESVAREANELARILNDQSRPVPSLRRYLSDIFKLRARSSVVAQELSRVRDIERIYPSLQNLDRDWQQLSHNLHQVRGLSTAVRDSIARLDELDQSLSEEINIESHLDRREVVAQSAALASDVRSLVEDIELELGNGSASRDILIEGRKAQQQASHVAYVAAWGGQNEIVDEYGRFSAIWRQLSRRLYNVNNRYIERGVRRVERTDGLIRELLLLPHESDRAHLARQTDILMRDVDEFFARTPLKLLVQLDRREYALATAEEFHGMCQNFKDLVNRNEADAELADGYHYVENSGMEFLTAFRSLRSSSGQIVLREIENGIDSLRDEMNDHDSFDRREAVDLAAAIENLGDHLAQDLEDWVRRQRPSWGNAAVREANQFVDQAHNLHSNLQPDRPRQMIQSDVVALKNTWRNLSNHLRLRNPSDRDHIELLRYRITPKLVDLMTILDL